MAFFGFDPSRHNPSHNTSAPGFSQANDPFAGLSGGNVVDNALEFEDTYDGLGDQLEETGDAFNDDTFGDSSTGGGVGGGIGGGGMGGGAGFGGSAKVGKDFDYYSQTAQVADAIDQEHMRFNMLQPATRGAPMRHDYNQGPPASSQHYGFFAPEPVSRPIRTGYEKYNEPEVELTVDAALWGVAPKKPAASAAHAPNMSATPVQAAIPGPSTSRKIMSLEEVEAAMRAKKAPAQQQQHAAPAYSQHIPEQYQQPPMDYGYGMPPPEMMGVPQQFKNMGPQMSILQRPPSQQTPPGFPPIPAHLQQQPPPPPPPPQQANQEAAINQPTQILQNANRHPVAGEMAPFGGIQLPFPTQQAPAHQLQDGSFGQPHIITHPSQVQGLSEEAKAVYMEQEAKRAKRNHKIFLLSKNNGLMTPQDKNFVTRIQLQQLVSATGNPNDHGTDEALKEDFYYQVLSQIRGSSRQHPSQPLNNFAQTYLFQTGSRMHSRRFMNRDRGAETHVQRMEQQVQRAVEAAKNRPKNKQLVIEGTLGKISFSNAKTPKPLLNIKRSENAASPASPSAAAAAAAATASAYGTASNGTANKTLDRKTVLSSIEKVYATLMEIEDQDRKMPPPPASDEDQELIQLHNEWSENSKQLAAKLWRYLKVHEQIGAYTVHPFIALLSFPKGMQAIPRVFRNLSREQRTTVLTMIIVHLDQLDIVRNAQANSGVPVTAAMRESIDRFSMTVNSTLFNFMNELELNLVTGVLGLVTNCNVDIIAKSRIGASVMTMVLSRAEEIKQANGGTPEDRVAWENAYNEFFNKIEPTLPYMFPGTVFVDEDIYVWQFLAAMGICATPEQHSRLVISVKDRVMDTVAAAKTLPVDLATQRKQSVNLFMRSIGLDVELLQ